jgi:universal stress protein E
MAAATHLFADPTGRPAALTGPAVFTHVACLTGLSPDGGVAEAHAGMLAQAAGAMLSLYHAIDVGAGYSPDAQRNGIVSAAERLARATLEAEAHTSGVLSARRQVVVEQHPLTGATMAAAVRRLDADLAVMAPGHHGLLARTLGFSLTEATVDRLGGKVPVLCARGEARPYRRILVATDFSQVSRRALRLAGRVATLFGADVAVVHAVPDPAEADGARAALQRFIPAGLAARSPRLVVEAGDPCTVILSAAAAVDADLVVLSTRGRDSLRDAVIGTRAQRVIRHAPCPVLVS